MWEGIGQQLAILLAGAVALAVIYAVDRPGGRWGATLRRRFLLGVPWGTLVTVAVVLSVYLFLQGGLRHWYRPVVIPFRAWSYFYPLGMLTAGVSHASASHVVGNLLGTLAVAPLAEYAWGHYRRERGSASFGSLRANPYVRAFVVFPAAALGASFITSLFALGPVVGFSGVVFAFAGFALVHYPLGTVVALAAARVVRLLYSAVRSPTAEAVAEPVYSTPWWADIAIQGHALGLFLGVLVGIAALRYRADEPPSALRVWAGVLLYSVTQGMWAVYWFRGSETFVLFRAAGLALVVLLATLVAAATAASDRPLFPRWAVRDVRTFGDATRSASLYSVALVALLLGFALVAGPGIPVNAFTVADDELPGETVTVRDYEVTYAENVSNGMVSVVEVEAFGETTAVNTSGVIVRSEERGLWTTAVPAGRLGFHGRAAVRLGGVGWRETVYAYRSGWVPTNAEPVYRVVFVNDDEVTPAFASESATAEPVVGGRNVSLQAELDGFRVVVETEGEHHVAPIPAPNESVEVGGLEIVREDDALYAVDGDTRVRVATKEVYGAEALNRR